MNLWSAANRDVADRGAVSRALTLVERGAPEAAALLTRLYPHTGRAHRVGITGAPGAGKSTLTMRLIQRLRAIGQRVAVIAVDPSSPLTGGAFLGDRARMEAADLDEGVFIRSMATRGATGGLATATADAADILDAAGFDVVLVETVGVGQIELEVVALADTTVVVLTPDSGDDLQAAKSGLMEIADVFALNKIDRLGGELVWSAVSGMLQLRRASREAGAWTPPVVRTNGLEAVGVEELLEAIRAHRAHGATDPARAQRAAERARRRILALATAQWQAWLLVPGGPVQQALERLTLAVVARRCTPREAAARLSAIRPT